MLVVYVAVATRPLKTCAFAKVHAKLVIALVVPASPGIVKLHSGKYSRSTMEELSELAARVEDNAVADRVVRGSIS